MDILILKTELVYSEAKSELTHLEAVQLDFESH